MDKTITVICPCCGLELKLDITITVLNNSDNECSTISEGSPPAYEFG